MTCVHKGPMTTLPPSSILLTAFHIGPREKSQCHSQSKAQSPCWLLLALASGRSSFSCLKWNSAVRRVIGCGAWTQAAQTAGPGHTGRLRELGICCQDFFLWDGVSSVRGLWLSFLCT